MDVVVIGGGPAGSSAALRAAELGARTVLVARGESANDGPIQVRTLAHAARLLRETRQLGQHGIAVSEPILDYPQLLVRTRAIVHDVCEHSTSREHLERVGVTIYEQSGTARFIDQHTVETGSGLRLRADKIILSAGGTSRRLSVPGFEWTATHRDAWGLTAIPPSMLVVGAGATGVQVASIFQTFGSRVQLFEAGPRILATEDDDVSAAVAAAFRQSGMVVRENFGNHRVVREDAEWSADGLLEGWHAGQRRGSARGRGGRLDDRHGRPQPVGRTCRDRSSGLCAGRRIPPDLGAEHPCGRRHYRPPSVSPTSLRFPYRSPPTPGSSGEQHSVRPSRSTRSSAGRYSPVPFPLQMALTDTFDFGLAVTRE